MLDNRVQPAPDGVRKNHSVERHALPYAPAFAFPTANRCRFGSILRKSLPVNAEVKKATNHDRLNANAVG